MMREDLQPYKLTEINHLKVHGRTTGELAPLTLFWTGSGIELNAKGSELWLEIEADYNTYEPWISILINSTPVSRQMLTAGRHWVCVFRGMNKETVKNVRIVRELQAMSEDNRCLLQFHRIKFDGEFLPVEERPYKLEFIGDSITSGEGAIGAKQEEDWIPMWFSAVQNYTAMTAEALNADYRVISQSGWGVLTSWDNNPNCSIPKYYTKVCGLLKGDRNKELGALCENDFQSWKPDAVIVNLGTNDGSAFHSPEWRDEATGETHKQRLKEDGTFHEEDIQAFEAAVMDFLYKLRNIHKDAYILWAYGMLGLSMMPFISRAVETYIRTTGDQKVLLIELPATTPETLGARQHPGVLAHKAAAEVLSKVLRELLSNKV